MGVKSFKYPKSIYNMELNEIMEPESGGLWESLMYIIRVPGGWIYNYIGQSVFVPYNNEFDRGWVNDE